MTTTEVLTYNKAVNRTLATEVIQRFPTLLTNGTALPGGTIAMNQRQEPNLFHVGSGEFLLQSVQGPFHRGKSLLKIDSFPGEFSSYPLSLLPTLLITSAIRTTRQPGVNFVAADLTELHKEFGWQLTDTSQLRTVLYPLGETSLYNRLTVITCSIWRRCCSTRCRCFRPSTSTAI